MDLMGSGRDPAQATQEAIDLYLTGATDDFKASLYAYILDGWPADGKLNTFTVARCLDLAETPYE